VTPPLDAPAAPPSHRVAAALDVAVKTLLVLLLVGLVLRPDLGNLEGKGATERAIAYPLLSFALPAWWWLRGRGRTDFPWIADLLISITCFSDLLGNRLDLYDTVRRFDDVVHLVNTGLLTAAFLMLTLARRSTRGQHLERALAFGATAALAWELAEYAAFLATSQASDRYADTLGDMALGVIGSAGAALLVHRARDARPAAAPQRRPAAQHEHIAV